MFELTNRIPAPEQKIRRRRGMKYPFAMMNVGDSFFAPTVKLSTMKTNFYRAAKLLNRKFTAQQTLEGNVLGVRVWRTK